MDCKNIEGHKREIINNILYHGTRAENVYSIAEEGLKIGERFWGQCSGHGLYTSSRSGAALWGDYIVKCKLAQNSRIINTSEPDKKVINYLKREFGKGILSPDFWKILPKNKQLTKNEIISLYSYLVKSPYNSTIKKRKKLLPLLYTNLSRINKQLRYFNIDGIKIDQHNYIEIFIFNPSNVEVISLHSLLLNPNLDTFKKKCDFWDNPYDEGILLSNPLDLKTLKEIQLKAVKENIEL